MDHTYIRFPHAISVDLPILQRDCGPGYQMRTLVVEAVADLVADLVADDRADRSVVGRIVAIGIEERILQDRGREHDLVHARVVVGVDRLGGHVPLIAVDRFADLVQLPAELKSMSRPHVGHEIRRVDPEVRAVQQLPRAGVSFGPVTSLPHQAPRPVMNQRGDFLQRERNGCSQQP
jgi:hypothetical protein